MRANEFLTEIKMSPSSLRKEAESIQGALAGLEFELVVPGIAEPETIAKPDYEDDARPTSIDDICDFFYDYNGRSHIQALRKELEQNFKAWQNDELTEMWEVQGYDYFVATLDPEDEDSAKRLWALEGSQYEAAKNDFMHEYEDQYDEKSWLRSTGLRWMEDVHRNYNIAWPHWIEGSEKSLDLDYVTTSFESAINKEVVVSDGYHQISRSLQMRQQYYIIETDSSIHGDDKDDAGLEVVSPPMPIADMLSDLSKVVEWASNLRCYTNDSTGLHMNVSIPNFDVANLDYVKLALLLGDEYVLEQFGRESNTYCSSAMNKIKNMIEYKPEEAATQVLVAMKSKLSHMATQAIHTSMHTEKYTSIGIKHNRIEFRSPGGDWLKIYKENPGKLTNTLLRFVVALDAACDPQKYRQEYLKKLYKMLEPVVKKDIESVDSIKIFADYVAGNFSKATLIVWVRQLQKYRLGKTSSAAEGIYDAGAKDGKENQGLWEIYNSANPTGSGYKTSILPKPDDFNIRSAAIVLRVPIENLRVRYIPRSLNESYEHPEAPIYYLAYGMLTDPELMHDAELIGIGELKNFELKMYSYANIEPKAGSTLYGSLWIINRKKLQELDLTEDYPRMYDRKTVPVYCDGKKYPAEVYLMTPDTIYNVEGSSPSSSYIKRIKNGYTHAGIPIKQLETAVNRLTTPIR